jgi:hypothetical protein
MVLYKNSLFVNLGATETKKAGHLNFFTKDLMLSIEDKTFLKKQTPEDSPY